MPTIAGSLRATARRVPDATALKFGELGFTYRELDAAVDRMAATLRGAGLGKGDRLALVSPSSERFVIAFYGALRIGAIVVPVNPALAAPEMEYLVSDSGAVVVAYAPDLAEVIGRAEFGSGVRRLPLDGASDGAGAGAGAAVHPAAADGEVHEHDDAVILYTSGTTGYPKGALFDHHRLMWVAFNCVATCGMRTGDRFLHVAPLYHAADLCIMLVPGTMIGATHVVMAGFEPVAVLDALAGERITMCFGVPTMFQALLGQADLAERDLSAWRTALFGAAPMPASAVERLAAELPGVALIQLCGQTEAGPGGIYADAEQVIARPDASGRQALPFTEFRVVDERDRDVPPGGEGELILRGETIMKGYWGKPAETAEALRDGWLRTGDVARVDQDGYVTLVDRLKDVIITGGRNVYSVEVENAVAGHPDVADCAVVARPHETYGESIVAVVTPRPGSAPDLESIREFCSGRIARYKLPHDLVLLDIPRNPSGKVLKRQLRDQVGAT